MPKHTMEAALQIKEKRAKELINLIKKWQAEENIERASDLLKMMCDRLRDPREIVFLAYQHGRAMATAEFAYYFEKYTGQDFTVIMGKMREMGKRETISLS